MNYFVSFTGKNYTSHAEVGEYVDSVRGSLHALGHDVITMYDTADEPIGSPPVTFITTMRRAFRLLEASDRLLCLMQQATPGYGMLMEIGYANAKDIPIVMATHQDAAGHYLEEIAVGRLSYSDSIDLGQKLHLLTDEST